MVLVSGLRECLAGVEIMMRLGPGLRVSVSQEEERELVLF